MLKSLHVKDFALVHSLDILFESGLTVITGESGAGKSIILGALGLVLGDRATGDAIRPQASRADVSAEFELSGNASAQAYLAQLSLEDPDQPGRCLVRRVVTSEGRSRAFINGTPVNLRLLKGLTGDLIDIHSQHEHQRLAAADVQLALLDDYGVSAAERASCREAFRTWKSAQVELARLTESVQGREDRASLLSYQLEELINVNPLPDEFAAISREHKRQNQAQSLQELVNVALAALEGNEALEHAHRELARMDDEHPDLASAIETLASALALAEDATRDLRRYESSLEHDPAALEQLDQRLTILHELGRKHRVEPDELPALRASLQTEFDSISTDRSAIETLQIQLEQQELAYREHAAAVSQQRHSAAAGFATAVSACMESLGIQGGSLSLEFSPAESENGLETVEFHCVTNPKYPAAPLTRIASGGERARISLAIQVVAAEKSALPSLVLDEADVGVGGTTADVVGRLLRSLARHTQVICVTHAPQVAALGHQHMRVHKTTDQDTQIDPLAPGGRIDELARMLAGAGVTEKSRDYAQTLLQEAADSALH